LAFHSHHGTASWWILGSLFPENQPLLLLEQLLIGRDLIGLLLKGGEGGGSLAVVEVELVEVFDGASDLGSQQVSAALLDLPDEQLWIDHRVPVIRLGVEGDDPLQNSMNLLRRKRLELLGLYDRIERFMDHLGIVEEGLDSGLILTLLLDNVRSEGRRERKQGEDALQTLGGIEEMIHRQIGLLPRLLAIAADELRFVKEDHPPRIPEPQKEMGKEVVVIQRVFRLGERFVELRLFTGDPPVDPVDLMVGDEIPHQIGLQKILLFRIVALHQTGKMVVQAVGLQPVLGIEQQMLQQNRIGRKPGKLLGEPRLGMVGQIRVGHQLRIQNMQLVKGRLLGKGDHRDDHVPPVRQLPHRIEQMGLALPVLPADDGRFALLRLDDPVEGLIDRSKKIRPRLAEVSPDRP
jgi:hypothetical protein